MKKIIVAGGGIAGKTFIDELQKKKADIQITLIEPKDYLEVPYARLRAVVNPTSFSPKIRKNYSEMLPDVKHIKDRVKSIRKNSITLDSGKSMDFDFLILATGAHFENWEYLNSGEKSIDDRQKSVEEENYRIKKSKSILIIGGGPVGVEVAGELASAYPDKNIKIVQRGERILGPALSEKMSSRAEKILTEMGVEIITNKHYTKRGDGSWQDEKGDKAQADLVIPAVGSVVNSQWALESGDISTDKKNAVSVDGTLRITGRDNIYAIGDVNDVPELKLGALASSQAKLTASNIYKQINGKEKSLKSYKPSPPLGFVTLGPQKSAVQLPFGHLHFMGAMKQKELFVSMYLK